MKQELVIVILVGLSVSLAHNGISHTRTDEGVLKFVQVVFRHGDRNPLDPYPFYPHKNESYWPEGFGQLTKRGKMQQYELGQYLRHRYEDYLSERYSPYEIFVQSSNVDRTITSAEANLAGLYPPKDESSLWNPQIEWQPIPVHTLAFNNDPVLKMNGVCPRYKEVEKDFLKNSAEMKKFDEQYGYLYDLLTNKTGRLVDTPEEVNYIYDLLFIQNNYYPPGWPDWAPEGSKTLDDIRHVTAFSFKELTFTPEMKRLKGGPLLEELLKNLNAKVSGTLDERRRINMYSAHDTTVAIILNTIGVLDLQIPRYCITVMLELRQREPEEGSALNNTYFVKIFLRNNTETEPYLLDIPNCGTECSLDSFNELMKPHIPEDWERECHYKSSQHFYDSIGTSVAVLSVGSLALFLLIATSMCIGLIKNRRHDRESKPPPYPYLHLQMEDEEA